MSNAIKWGLLVAGAVIIIGMIVALPFVDFINVDEFGQLLSKLVYLAGDGFVFGRGLLNNFLTPFGRAALTGLLFWFFGKWAITVAIKIVVWAYHFIFK